MTSRLFIVLTLLLIGFIPHSSTVAQNTVELDIHLRDAEGQPLANEPIRIAEPFAPSSSYAVCLTNAEGMCRWGVTQGVYEVHWGQTLDALSQVASAENGLQSIGITVGQTPITYHFVLHNNDHIYFDAASASSVPQPIIPSQETLFTHGVDRSVESTTTMPLSEPVVVSEVEVSSTSSNGWHLLLFVALGLCIGGSLHYWSRQHIGGQPDA